MSLVDRFTGNVALADPLSARWETRASLEDPNVPLTGANISKYFGSRISDSGVPVNPDTIMRLAVAYRCIAILAGSLGQLPAHAYERTDRGKRKATDRPEDRILSREPNPELTAAMWKESGQVQLCLRGNTYSRIDWANNGRVRALWPIPTDTVIPERVAGRLNYRVSLVRGGVENLSPEEVIHVPALSFDGIVGYNPIEVLRQSAGIAISAEKVAATLYKDGIRGSGILILKDADSQTAVDNMRAEFSAQYGGSLHAPVVVGGNAEWKPVTINPDDAQFLETRKFQRGEIATVYGIPPHMVGDVEKSTSWGTGIEQQSIGFVVYCLAPWLVRWEQELSRKLFPGSLGDQYFVKFNIAGLLRGDLKTQYEAYQIGIQNGWLSPNDVLEMLDMNTFDGGDTHIQPLNFAPWGTAPADPAPSDPSPTAGGSTP